MADYYEIRFSGQVLCAGTVPNLGYPVHILEDMYRYGYILYRNGKRVKKCELGLA